MSRLHEPSKCVAFYHHLQQVQPCQPPDSTPLTQHMSLCSCNFPFFPGSKDPQLAQQLQQEIYQYCFDTFAEGTKASYRIHGTSYLRFCEHMGYPHLPAHSSHLCQSATFLAHSLKATSIPNYLKIIGILRKEFNLPNPLLENWPLQSLLTGIKWVKGIPSAQKQPITLSIFGQIYSHLNTRSC